MTATATMFFCIIVVNIVLFAGAACQNRCNKNGLCNRFGTCDCFKGFMGAECSLKTCPYGPTITGIAVGEDSLHDTTTECSGKGSCNYKTGNCDCYPNYNGPSCNRMSCFNNCSGRGVCTSLRVAATENDGFHFNRSTVYSQWDADLFQGCKCDPGWSGADCSVRECAYGLDPRTTSNTHEIISLVCSCFPICVGKFKLRMLGHDVMKWFKPTSTSNDVAEGLTLIAANYAKNNLYSYNTVTTLSSPNQTICQQNSVTTTQFKFRKTTANIPTISFYANLFNEGNLFFQSNQMLHCDCTNRVCNGTFRLSFDGEMSGKLNTWGNSSNIILALRNMNTINAGGISVIDGIALDGPVCVTGTKTNHTITFFAAFGNVPQLQLWSSVIQGPIARPLYYYSTDNTTNVLTITKNGGNEDTVKLCNGIGKCNFQTASCQCPYVSTVCTCCL